MVWLLCFLLSVSLLSGERAPGFQEYDYIVGGRSAVRGEFPFVVKVVSGGASCTGSLIKSESSDRVLTAKHCLDDGFGGTVYFENSYKRFSSKAVTRHSSEDLAYIDLGERVTGRGIDYVPISQSVFVGVVGVSVGYGRINSDSLCSESNPRAVPSYLQKAPVRIRGATSKSLTAGMWKGEGGYVECGDSGGPLLIWGMREWTQVGVTTTTNHSDGGGYVNLARREIHEWLGIAETDPSVEPEPDPDDPRIWRETEVEGPIPTHQVKFRPALRAKVSITIRCNDISAGVNRGKCSSWANGLGGESIDLRLGYLWEKSDGTSSDLKVLLRKNHWRVIEDHGQKLGLSEEYLNRPEEVLGITWFVEVNEKEWIQE